MARRRRHIETAYPRRAQSDGFDETFHYALRQDPVSILKSLLGDNEYTGDEVPEEVLCSKGYGDAEQPKTCENSTDLNASNFENGSSAKCDHNNLGNSHRPTDYRLAEDFGPVRDDQWAFFHDAKQRPKIVSATSDRLISEAMALARGSTMMNSEIAIMAMTIGMKRIGGAKAAITASLKAVFE